MAILLIDPSQQQFKQQQNQVLIPLFALIVVSTSLLLLWQHASLYSSHFFLGILAFLVLTCLGLFWQLLQSLAQIRRSKLLSRLLIQGAHASGSDEELEQKRFSESKAVDGLWHSIVACLGVAGLAGLLTGVFEGVWIGIDALVTVAATVSTVNALTPLGLDERGQSSFLANILPREEGLSEQNMIKDLPPALDHPELPNETKASSRVENTLFQQECEANVNSAIEESLFEQGNEQDLSMALLEHSQKPIVVQR